MERRHPDGKRRASDVINFVINQVEYLDGCLNAEAASIAVRMTAFRPSTFLVFNHKSANRRLFVSGHFFKMNLLEIVFVKAR
jgi:hypothetical protein